MSLYETAEFFGLSGITTAEALRTGHINKTILVECTDGKYIFQSLNRDIFADAETVMNNIAMIERAYANDPLKRTDIPHFLRCGRKNYVGHDGEIWRAYRYIEEGEKPFPVEYHHGFAVGDFLRVVNSQDIVFGDSLPIHRFDLPLPMRNIHGDTKAANVIFGEKPVIIDLDTAMRGYLCVDYGDMIRSLTTEGFDEEKIYYATDGFANAVKGFITEIEVYSLYVGILCVIEELAERYRKGRTVFPNKTERQCKARVKQLAAQLEAFKEHGEEFAAIIKECF